MKLEQFQRNANTRKAKAREKANFFNIQTRREGGNHVYLIFW